METALKAGQRVLFLGNPLDQTQSNVMVRVKEKKIYGVIANSSYRTKYYISPANEVVDFSHYPAFVGGTPHFIIRRSELQVINEKDYPEVEAILEADLKEIQNFAKLLKEKCFTASKKSYVDRTFKFEDKQELNTNHSYVCLGEWKNDTFSLTGSTNYRPNCCAFTKSQFDMDVYIPQVWLNYFGYTPFDLVEWCKFLKKCGFGFDYEFHGVSDLDESFRSKIDKTARPGEHVEQFKVGKKLTYIYPKGMDGFYRIILKGSIKMHSYMRFICLRYIYNDSYWTIPGHAMQIKKALGGTVTHWEALLLAHLHVPYFGYYNLVSQIDFDSSKPRFGEEEIKKSGFSGNITGYTGANYNRHVDPFQSVETILEKLKSTEKMNETFLYLTDILKREELNKFFDAKDYVGLYKYVLTAKAKAEQAK